MDSNFKRALILENYEKLSFTSNDAKLVVPKKSFWDVIIDDIFIENYNHMGRIDFEVTK